MNGADLTVLSHRFDGIARTMANVLLRTGRSGVLNRGKDLSCCIVSKDCELITAAESLPIHVLSGPDIMARSMKRYHPQLKAGDAFLENSPYHGCSHAADHTLIVPVVDTQGLHQFTVMAKAHQADIGNSQPTTYFAGATDVYQEGALLFPSVKVQDAYETIDDIVRMCELRIRVPDQWRGDFLAMIGAARVGEAAMLRLGEEYGWDTLQAFATEWLAYGERAMTNAIRRLPAGRGVGRSTHDTMPGMPEEGLTITSTVTVDPEAGLIEVDLSDNPDCIPSGFNLSEACSRSAAYLGILNGLGAEMPRGGGALRRIRVVLRENCVVGIPHHPTSCSLATTNVADRATAATQKAFSDIAPGLGMAEVGPINPPAKGVISGLDPRSGRRFINQLFLGSTGGGATPHNDAWLTYSHVGNGGMAFIESVEMAELHHPILVLRRMLRPDSEGAGERIGAPCLEIELGPVGAEVTIVYTSDGTINPAEGIRGGGRGGCAGQSLRDEDGREQPLGPVGRLVLRPGQRVVSVGSGGGGYGDPMTRDAGAVAAAVRDELMTRGRARQVYGVCVDGRGLDLGETARLRGAAAK